MTWVNLAEGVNLDYLRQRNIGEILGFDYEGSRAYYKIKRIDKKRDRYWAESVTLYRPEEVSITDKESASE